MLKQPEGLKSARSNTTWLDFLADLGIGNAENKVKGEKRDMSGSDFWSAVRKKLAPAKPARITKRTIAEHGIVKNYGRRLKSGKRQVVYRSYETGQFISIKSLKNA